MRRDPFKLPGVGLSLPGMWYATSNVLKKPYFRITQGGSSRLNAPAKRAATLGAARANVKANVEDKTE